MKKITQVSMLFIALFFMNVTLNAQSGDYEYLFNTDGDAEGITIRSGGPIEVAGGVLTYTHGGTGINLPIGNLIDKTNFPYIAVQMEQLNGRLEFFLRTDDGVGGWYNETDVEADERVDLWEYDETLNSQGVYFWNVNYEFWDKPAEALTDGGTLDLVIMRLSDGTPNNTKINWIKTFASIEAIDAYAAANPFPTLGVNDVAQSQTRIISGVNKIDINKIELNAKVQVFDLLGKSLFSSVAKSDRLSIDINTTGVYIVKIVGASSVITKKVLVN